MTDRNFKCERLWSTKTLVDRTVLFSSIQQLYISYKRIGIPHYKFSGKLWFDPVEIDDWIQRHHHGSAKEGSAKHKKVRLLKP